MEEPIAARRGPKPITALRLLKEIKRDQDECGGCLATDPQLATRVERTQRQVRYALKRLRDSGRILRDWVPNSEYPHLNRRRLRLPEP